MHTGVSFGLSMASSLMDTSSCTAYIDARKENSIRLLYPNLDFGFNYQDGERLRRLWDQEQFEGRMEVGSLMPTFWVAD
jgi:hypothetical protein